MRVGINVAILSTRLSGVGYYALSLVQALARVGTDIEWVFFGADPSVDRLPRGENIHIEEVPRLVGVRRVLWEQTMLPRLAVQAGVEILHCPDFSRPILTSFPVINTIHDLSYYASDRFFPLARRTYKRSMVRVAIKRSVGIIADSYFTRQEILERFSIDLKRIFVIHLGVDSEQERQERITGPPFLLYVGTLEERKDIVTLVRAFTHLRERRRIPHRLILVGQQGWGWPTIQDAIKSSTFRHEIDVRGYISRDEVLELYRSADVFVYPSVYEGFGLPVLEAMSCGTPVICSRAASLPEVAGDAAEYFEPSSADDLAGAIERVLESAELHALLRRKGLERARLFSWDECARKHCEVYRNVLQA